MWVKFPITNFFMNLNNIVIFLTVKLTKLLVFSQKLRYLLITFLHKKVVYISEKFTKFSMIKLYSTFKIVLVLLIGFEAINFISAIYILTSQKVIVLQIILIVFVILNFFKRSLTVILLKKSKYLKEKYKTYPLVRKTNRELLSIFFIYLLQKFLLFYKNYPLYLFTILVFYSYFVKNILLLSLFWCHFIYDAVLELPYLQSFKKKRAGDILSFNYHWNFDKDLVLLKRVLIFVYAFGFSITYFSYFIFISRIGEVANEYTFLFLNFTISLRDIQYYLAMNLIGPILLVACIFIKIILNLHVIYCRNPSTVLRGFATFSSTISAVGVGTALVGLASAGFGLGSVYHSGGVGPDSMAKNTVDGIKDGVVRHTVQQDQAFVITKKFGIDTVPKNIIVDKSTKILDMDKLHEELSLKKNEKCLEQIPAADLQVMGFTDLISEIKLLRHNLLVYTNLGNGFSKDDYILRFNLQDKNERIIHGLDSPSKEEIHNHYKAVAATLCKTPAHVEELNDFITGKSDRLFYSFRFQQEFGILSNKKDIVSSVFVGTPRVNSESELQRLARNIPKYLLECERQKKIYPSDLDHLNDGEALIQRINRPMPLLIKNEPENP